MLRVNNGDNMENENYDTHADAIFEAMHVLNAAIIAANDAAGLRVSVQADMVQHLKSKRQGIGYGSSDDVEIKTEKVKLIITKDFN